jgi:hypothetical protein
MSGGSFTPTVTMFEVLSDRDCHFPRYEKQRRREEYGMSTAQFLDEHGDEALADVQDIWDRADPALRRELLMACQERLMQKIRQMEEEYRQTDKERHRYEVCADFKQNG